MRNRHLLAKTLFLFLFLSGHIDLFAQDSTDFNAWYNLHIQMTYINQTKPKMHALYSGPYSLQAEKEKQNSLTTTAFLGLRLWKGAAFYFNPEIAGGSGLSGAQGMGGSSNGETFRVGNPSPTLYVGRAYLQQTFALGTQASWQDDDQNQLRLLMPNDYVRLTVGKYSLADLFDNNAFSNSPRTQFMNWSLMNNGAWDFAANVRGYTYIATAEISKAFLNYKISIANLPKEANGAELNTHLNQELALNTEVAGTYKIQNKKGNLRLLYFLNRAGMGDYQQAIAAASTNQSVPDITATRESGRKKWGLGVNFDQELGKDFGLFGRYGMNDGKTETWNFTEIDNALSIGTVADGRLWHRRQDNAGLAIVTDGLSKDHRSYIAHGGNGFILGDGKLNYGKESIAELYYNLKPTDKPIWITGDYQYALHPGYNKDRGPASIFSVRVHTEF